MKWVREPFGGQTLSVYRIDDAVPNDVLDRLNEDGRIIETTYISLNDAQDYLIEIRAHTPAFL
jgi:predicted PhzF superfamily epimerase YddE/YHI9